MNWTLLQQLLLVAITNSTITVSFIQKTKHRCRKKHHITIYSFFVNLILGLLFTYTFTDLDLIYGLWVGLFSYIGADTIYKTLEGKLSSYTDLIPKTTPDTKEEIPSTTTEDDIVGEIPYD